MVINIKNLSDILDDKLSLSERGILITILLLKEKDSKLTLAKCKTKISFLKNKKELINLHRLNYISWSGYQSAVQSLTKKESQPQVLEILNFMNQLYRRNFGPTEERSTSINNLLLKYTMDDIKKVISNRYVVWKDEPVMSKHLVPETIFRSSKFIKYLDEVNYTKEGESFVTIRDLMIQDGDEVDSEIAKSFSDKDLYTLRSYSINKLGEVSKRSTELTRTGKDIKRLLKVRDSQDWKDFKLIYIQK